MNYTVTLSSGEVIVEASICGRGTFSPTFQNQYFVKLLILDTSVKPEILKDESSIHTAAWCDLLPCMHAFNRNVEHYAAANAMTKDSLQQSDIFSAFRAGTEYGVIQVGHVIGSSNRELREDLNEWERDFSHLAPLHIWKHRIEYVTINP